MERKRKTMHTDNGMSNFGDKVFSLKVMKGYLSAGAFKSLESTIRQGTTLDPKIADEVAEAMKTWAMERGATHYTHWFHPLTGTTAEKHEAFLVPDKEGGVIFRFSGKDLIKGESDASSFPSGGLRVTFEARGYTAWDPTSPAFLKTTAHTAVLCIPTVFCGYYGEALDKKTPLLRSISALSEQLCRLGRLFGIKTKNDRALIALGAEQEYFLVDKKYYNARFDLVQTGRTLFGHRPPKHQQMEDHYFGAIKTRVLEFMADLDKELWSLGVPSRIRHNEVCPGQYEVVPVFEEMNLAIDHNMLVMEVLRGVADRHGFACLLHEKPYAGVNGSGKHCNWSVHGPDGKNWLSPGANPHDNAKFLTIISALIMAVDRHADLLRATVATANNDHRLGTNEAPPTVISIFLGSQLSEVFRQIELGKKRESRSGGTLQVGVTSLPVLPRDATDRNRTSPLAFTGTKFEFRAVGASRSCAWPATVLNTIMTEALDEICTELESGKGDFNGRLQKVLNRIAKQHKRIIFDGDSYSEAWLKEAAKRGLPNAKTAPEALGVLLKKDKAALFSKYGVLTERELSARYDIYKEAYEKTILIEAECALTISRTMILASAVRAQAELVDALRGSHSRGLKRQLSKLSVLTDALMDADTALEKAIKSRDSKHQLKAMSALRAVADEIEYMVPDDLWPLPSYAEMMFMM